MKISHTCNDRLYLEGYSLPDGHALCCQKDRKAVVSERQAAGPIVDVVLGAHVDVDIKGSDGRVGPWQSGNVLACACMHACPCCPERRVQRMQDICRVEKRLQPST